MDTMERICGMHRGLAAVASIALLVAAAPSAW